MTQHTQETRTTTLSTHRPIKRTSKSRTGQGLTKQEPRHFDALVYRCVLARMCIAKRRTGLRGVKLPDGNFASTGDNRSLVAELARFTTHAAVPHMCKETRIRAQPKQLLCECGVMPIPTKSGLGRVHLDRYAINNRQDERRNFETQTLHTHTHTQTRV